MTLPELKKERSNLVLRIKILKEHIVRKNKYMRHLHQELDVVNDKIVKELK